MWIQIYVSQMSPLIPLLLLTVVTVGWPAAGASAARLLLLGDSITYGVVSEPQGPSFAELTDACLAGEFDEVEVIACSGSTSSDWTLTRGARSCAGRAVPISIYEALARPHLPAEVVTVLLGTNDAFGFFEESGPIPPEQYGSSLREITMNLLRDGVEQIVLMTPPRIFGAPNPETNARLSGYREQIRLLCGASPDDAIVCGPDLQQQMRPEHFAAQSLHPNAAGHALIARELCDALKPGSRFDPSLAVGAAILVAAVCVGAGIVVRNRARF